uniref:C2 domain-containing protein n=1 Tax=Soboliphyme baturini TaxID=241478 RepID=A0A183IG61_9BILA
LIVKLSRWLPPNKSLGEFVTDLGPGQVVGRQVLASPCLGEIQICMVERKENLEIKIVRARNLSKKPGAKCYPAPYVKVYLLDGKSCLAKAKTAVATRTPEPRFDQHLIFTAPYGGKMLQITVMGDYGRMERRSIIGMAIIRLSSLDLSHSVEGWYKLFPTSAVIGPDQVKKEDPT